jgi:hypothetical protein
VIDAAIWRNPDIRVARPCAALAMVTSRATRTIMKTNPIAPAACPVACRLVWTAVDGREWPVCDTARMVARATWEAIVDMELLSW